MNRVFLDSSVLFTAVNSPTGGSAKLFTLANTRLITSTFVLTEVERNVRKKLLTLHLDRYFILVKRLRVIEYFPDEKALQVAVTAIAAKDAVILAQAKRTDAHYLLTLDTKHFLTPKAKAYLHPKKIFTPKEFLISSSS